MFPFDDVIMDKPSDDQVQVMSMQIIFIRVLLTKLWKHVNGLNSYLSLKTL